MGTRKSFWDRTAGLYDRFMRKDAGAYEQLYALIRPLVRDKTVLELATGTGLIARHIADAARLVEATDASPEMIAQAERPPVPGNLRFSVHDLFRLPYGARSFDVVIAANVLHIIPRPERALAEMGRVLKEGGALIVPTFTHEGNSPSGRRRLFFMKLAGFPLYSRWSSGAYLAFLEENGWHIEQSTVLAASFPLTYAVCRKAPESTKEDDPA